MEELTLTEEEFHLITQRRMMQEARKAHTPAPGPQKPKVEKTDVVMGKNRPAGWDSHEDVGKCHKGRLTEGHPFHFFETDIFKRISNMEHQAEHKKISTVLGLPVQNANRDRVYHLLSHMDVLWYENRLPLKYKKLQEDLKKEHGVGPDNIPSGQKKKGVIYKLPKVKLPEWNEDLYDIDMSEEFTGITYNYDDFLKAE